MKKMKRFSPAWNVVAIATVLGTASPSLTAEEVRVFTAPPSADEMAKLLFPDKAVGQRPKVKTRSLMFTPRAQKKKQAQAQPASQKTVGIALPIQFAFGSAELLGEARSYLDEIGRMLTMDQFKEERIVLEGHTDAIGSAEYNKHLSLARAQAVKAYLVRRFDVDPQRLLVVGRGEEEPLPGRDPNDGDNRRVELHRATKQASN